MEKPRRQWSDEGESRNKSTEVINYLLEQGISELVEQSLQLSPDKKAVLKNNLRQWGEALGPTAALDFMNPGNILDAEQLQSIINSSNLQRGVRALAEAYLRNIEEFGGDALAQLRLPSATHYKLVRRGIDNLTNLRGVIDSPGGLVSGWGSDGKWKNAVLTKKPAAYVKQRLEQFDSSRKSNQTQA